MIEPYKNRKETDSRQNRIGSVCFYGRRQVMEKIIFSILATIAMIATEVIKYHDENED